MIKGKTKTAIIAIITTIIVLGVVAGIVLIKFNDQKSFSQMEKLSGPGSVGLKEENEQVEISSEEKNELEKYINEICYPASPYKIEEFNDINEVSKEWIYAHVQSTTPYVSEEYIINYLQKLFGNDLIIDVKKDIASSEDVVMPTYDETTKKYVLPTYGMDNIIGYAINGIKLNNNEYIANVVEYNAMSDLYESDNNHELIISAYDENIEKTWKWKEIFRVSSDTSADEIATEVLKRKNEFQSYNITLEKNDNNFIVKRIIKNEINTNSEKAEYQKQVEEFEQDKKEIQKELSNIAYTNDSVQKDNVFKKIICPLNCEYEISAGFHGQANHTGIDYKASEGEKILAAMDGKIILSKYKGSYGNLVVIEHDDGVQTYYAHCSKLLKQEGETVSAGEEIAEIGSTGNATGTCLHFEMRIDGTPVNPMPYMK